MNRYPPDSHSRPSHRGRTPIGSHYHNQLRTGIPVCLWIDLTHQAAHRQGIEYVDENESPCAPGGRYIASRETEAGRAVVLVLLRVESQAFPLGMALAERDLGCGIPRHHGERSLDAHPSSVDEDHSEIQRGEPADLWVLNTKISAAE